MPTKTKKSVTKKPVMKKKPLAKKKPIVKKSSHVLKAVSHEHEEHVPARPIEKIIYKFQKHFVFIPKCSNCEHVPMRINKLVALMAVLVGLLSGMVIAQADPINLNELLTEIEFAFYL